MTIAYTIGTPTTTVKENYYTTCKGRNLNCSFKIENKVIGHEKVYISPFTGKFKSMNPPLQGGKIFGKMKPKILKIQGGARNVIPLIVHITHFYFLKRK